MDKIRIKGKINNIIKGIPAIVFSLMTTVVTPILILIYISDLNLGTNVHVEDYLFRLEQIPFHGIIAGIFLTSFVILIYLQRIYSVSRLIFSVISEILYCYYIVIWAGTGLLNFSIGTVTIAIDLSFLYLIFIIFSIITFIMFSPSYPSQEQFY